MKQTNLTIDVISAKLHKDVDQLKGAGKMDPFAELQLGSQKFTTKVAMNQGKLPKWGEQFGMNYTDKNYTLKVSVFDKDTAKKTNQLIGEGIVNLLKVETASNWSLALPLYNKQQDEGTIELVFDFIGKTKPEQSPKSETPQSEPRKSQQSEPRKSQQSNISQDQQLAQPIIDYNSIDYDAQSKELDRQIAAIQNISFIPFLQYVQDKNLQEILMDGLKHVRDTDPDDQIECMSQFLLNK